MLEKYKAMCLSTADTIPNWRSLTKDQLLNNYIKYRVDNPYLANGYIAAVMVKCWPVITKYWLQEHQSATLEDCFDWFTHGILYATGHRQSNIIRDALGRAVSIKLQLPSWLDPNKNASNLSSGGAAVLNKCFEASRLIYMQANDSHNRRINVTMGKLTRTKDDSDEVDTIEPVDPYDMQSNLWAKQLVQQAFKKHDTFRAFALHMIFTGDVFDVYKHKPDIVQCEADDDPYDVVMVYEKKTNGVLIKPKKDDDTPITAYKKLKFNTSEIKFNPKRLIKQLKHLDDVDCKLFSDLYKVNLDEVKSEAAKLAKYTSVKAHKRLEYLLESLKADRDAGLLHD